MPRVRRHRAPLLFYLVAVIAFGALATATVLWARGYTIDLAERGVYKTGLLVVRSNPSSAYITVNGRLRDKDTPANIKLRAGTYHLKVDRKGSLPYEQDVRIEPEAAVFLDHITLWRKNPRREALADKVIRFAVAPNQRQFTYLQTVPGGTAVWVSAPGDKPVKLTTLGTAYRKPTSLLFAGDGGGIAVASQKETTLIPLTGGASRLPVGGKISFAPGRHDAVLVQQAGRLTRVSAGGRRVLADKVSSWTVTAEATYFSVGRKLTRLDRNNGRQVVSQDVTLQNLRGLPRTDRLFAQDRNKGLYQIDPGRNEVRHMAGNVSAYRATPDGGRLVYVANFELHQWERRDDRDTLVTRFADPVSEPWPTAEGYDVIFRQGSSLRAIALTGAADQALVGVPRTTLVTVLEGTILLRQDDDSLSLQELLAP